MDKKIVLENERDKTFKLDQNVDHKKVIFTNKFGIDLVGDLYWLKEKVNQKLPAIAISGPFGAVKEQASGLYAMELAKRGFLTLAFDPSFTGESGGFPRFNASPDINTEDFEAAIDFLSNYEMSDANKIGIVGICGWGGLALNTASLDTRIKATIVSTMYDMSRVKEKGYFDKQDSEEERYKLRKHFSNLRTEIYKTKDYGNEGGCLPLPVNDDLPFYVKDYSEYYKGRAYHKRSLNSNNGWNLIGTMSYLNAPILKFTNEIRSAVLIIHGDKAHSFYMGKDAYQNTIKGNKYNENKEFLAIKGAVHTDLYDNLNVIPFDKIVNFLYTYLK